MNMRSHPFVYSEKIPPANNRLMNQTMFEDDPASTETLSMAATFDNTKFVTLHKEWAYDSNIDNSEKIPLHKITFYEVNHLLHNTPKVADFVAMFEGKKINGDAIYRCNNVDDVIRLAGPSTTRVHARELIQYINKWKKFGVPLVLLSTLTTSQEEMKGTMVFTSSQVEFQRQSDKVKQQRVHNYTRFLPPAEWDPKKVRVDDRFGKSYQPEGGWEQFRFKTLPKRPQTMPARLTRKSDPIHSTKITSHQLDDSLHPLSDKKGQRTWNTPIEPFPVMAPATLDLSRKDYQRSLRTFVSERVDEVQAHHDSMDDYTERQLRNKTYVAKALTDMKMAEMNLTLQSPKKTVWTTVRIKSPSTSRILR